MDRISGLPDHVLSDILFFLELREAVKTSVLSKRWEKVWTSIHRIRLDYKSSLPIFYHDLYGEDLNVEEERRTTFINFVYGVLTGNNKLSVTSFSLSYAFGSTIPHEIQFVTEWIAAVVTPILREFDFLIRECSMDLSINLLPPTLFECQKLVILRLTCNDLNTNICLNVPKTVCLPRLEKLHLTGVQLEDENSLKNVLSGCPVLEELDMQDIIILHKDNKKQNLFVFSPSLKILRVHMYREVPFYCYVKAPKLECLDLKDYSLLGFSMSASPSLVSAEIQIARIGNPSPLSVFELFRGISNVQKLELSICDIIMFGNELASLPEFSNLIHLRIRNCDRNGHIVNCILQKSPHLKHLVFFENYIDSQWSQPDSVPKCLVLHLETIEFSFRFQFNREDEMKIMEYFLDKGKVLKKMAITTSFPIEKCFNSRLMGFPRASVGCEIVVSGFCDISD